MELHGNTMPLEAVALIREGKMVQGIKVLRREFGLGLIEAKRLAEDIKAKLEGESPANKTPIEKSFLSLAAAQGALDSGNIDEAKAFINEAAKHVQQAMKEFDKFTRQLATWRQRRRVAPAGQTENNGRSHGSEETQ